MTFQQASCRAASYISGGTKSISFPGASSASAENSTFAAFPEVKRGSPGLLFSFSLPHRRGTLVLCSRDKHYGTHPSVLFGMCGTLSGAGQIDPLQNWVPLHGLGSPGGTYIPPLSTLVMLHARTSCVK